jgi:hypothetical protein
VPGTLAFKVRPGRPLLESRGRKRLLNWAAAAAEKPEWVLELERQAEFDQEAAALLSGTGGDPQLIQKRMKDQMDALHAQIMSQQNSGEVTPLKIRLVGRVGRLVEALLLWTPISVLASRCVQQS